VPLQILNFIKIQGRWEKRRIPVVFAGQTPNYAEHTVRFAKIFMQKICTEMPVMPFSAKYVDSMKGQAKYFINSTAGSFNKKNGIVRHAVLQIRILVVINGPNSNFYGVSKSHKYCRNPYYITFWFMNRIFRTYISIKIYF
jgi:hypothetical protein